MKPICVVCLKHVDVSTPHLKMWSISTWIYFHADPNGTYCYPNREAAETRKAVWGKEEP